MKEGTINFQGQCNVLEMLKHERNVNGIKQGKSIASLSLSEIIDSNKQRENISDLKKIRLMLFKYKSSSIFFIKLKFKRSK